MPSVVYKITDEDFSEAVKTSTSIRQVLLKLNLNETGSAYRVFKRRVQALGLDTSHLTGQSYLRGKSHNWATKKPFDEILVTNSSYRGIGRLKIRLLREGLLQNRCYGEGCSLTTAWLGKPIMLQLDHINGEHDDHRIENLRLLCPNCHSQTSTFAGRNQK